MKNKLYIITLSSLIIIYILGIINISKVDRYEDIYFPPQGDDIHVEEVDEKGLSKEEVYSTIYKVKKIKNINEYKNNLIEKLELSNIEEVTDDENIYLKNNDFTVQIFKNTGAFVLSNNKAKDEVDNMPSIVEVKNIAKNYVSKLGYSEYKIYNITKDERIQTLPNQEEKKEIIAYNVIFNRKIDDKEVYGGDRIEISIGNNGEINKAYVLIREYEAVKKIKIKSPYEAFEKIKNGEGVIYGNKSAKRVIFEKSEIVYWINPAPEEQVDVIPVYKFDNSDKENIDITSFINALKDEDVE